MGCNDVIDFWRFVLMLSGLELLELVSYGKFGFSRPDLDGNKPGKGNCLATKVRDKEVFVK